MPLAGQLRSDPRCPGAVPAGGAGRGSRSLPSCRKPRGGGAFPRARAPRTHRAALPMRGDAGSTTRPLPAPGGEWVKGGGRRARPGPSRPYLRRRRARGGSVRWRLRAGRAAGGCGEPRRTGGWRRSTRWGWGRLPTRPPRAVGRGLWRGRAGQEQEEEGGGGCRPSCRPLCPNPFGEGIRPQEETGFLTGIALHPLRSWCCPLRQLFALRASHIGGSERAGGCPGAGCYAVPFGNVLQLQGAIVLLEHFNLPSVVSSASTFSSRNEKFVLLRADFSLS